MSQSPRKTRHDYAAAGSWDRVQEAWIALLETDAEDDEGYHRNRVRTRAAVNAYRDARNQRKARLAIRLWRLSPREAALIWTFVKVKDPPVRKPAKDVRQVALFSET